MLFEKCAKCLSPALKNFYPRVHFSTNDTVYSSITDHIRHRRMLTITAKNHLWLGDGNAEKRGNVVWRTEINWVSLSTSHSSELGFQVHSRANV